MMMEWLLKKKGAYLHHYDLNRIIYEAINTGKPQALGIYHDLDKLRQKMVTHDREYGLETVIACVRGCVRGCVCVCVRACA